jgi:hypothetical protein
MMSTMVIFLIYLLFLYFQADTAAIPAVIIPIKE